MGRDWSWVECSHVIVPVIAGRRGKGCCHGGRWRKGWKAKYRSSSRNVGVNMGARGMEGEIIGAQRREGLWLKSRWPEGNVVMKVKSQGPEGWRKGGMEVESQGP